MWITPDSNPSKDAKVDGNTTTLLSYQRSLMTLNMIKRDSGDSADWGVGYILTDYKQQKYE